MEKPEEGVLCIRVVYTCGWPCMAVEWFVSKDQQPAAHGDDIDTIVVSVVP